MLPQATESRLTSCPTSSDNKAGQGLICSEKKRVKIPLIQASEVFFIYRVTVSQPSLTLTKSVAK